MATLTLKMETSDHYSAKDLIKSLTDAIANSYGIDSFSVTYSAGTTVPALTKQPKN